MYLNIPKSHAALVLLTALAATARIAHGQNVSALYAYEKVACFRAGDCGAAHRWTVRPKDGRAVGIAVRALALDVGAADCESGSVAVYNASLDAAAGPVCNVTAVEPSKVWCGRLEPQTIDIEFAGDPPAITVELCAGGKGPASLYLKFKEIHGGACGERETDDYVDFHGAVPTWDNPTSQWRYPAGTKATRHCFYGHGIGGNGTQRTVEAVCGKSGRWDADYAEGACEGIVSPIGGPCDRHEACAAPARCNGTVCDCAEPQYLTKSGDACEAPLGAKCKLNATDVVCAEGTFCDKGTLTCGCEPPTVVHPVDGDSCVAIVRPGGACNGTGELCANGTGCVSAVCQCDEPTVLQGEECVPPATTTSSSTSSSAGNTTSTTAVRCYLCHYLLPPSGPAPGDGRPCNATIECGGESRCYAETRKIGGGRRLATFGCEPAAANCTSGRHCCSTDLCNALAPVKGRPSDAHLYPLYAVAVGLALLLLVVACGHVASAWAAKRGDGKGDSAAKMKR